MKKILAGSLVALSVSSCAVNVTPVATGGSKADGTVVISYEFGAFEQPIVNWEAAEADAKARCKAWGYKKASPFGGGNNVCVARNGYGNCIRMRVETTFQCTSK